MYVRLLFVRVLVDDVQYRSRVRVKSPDHLSGDTPTSQARPVSGFESKQRLGQRQRNMMMATPPSSHIDPNSAGHANPGPGASDRGDVAGLEQHHTVPMAQPFDATASTIAVGGGVADATRDGQDNNAQDNNDNDIAHAQACLLYTSPSPRDRG